MTYIEMKDEDISKITDLYIRTFNQEPWNDHWEAWSVQKRLNQMAKAPDFYGLMMYQDDSLVGFILGNQQQYYDGIKFEIKEFCIDPHHQSGGYGTKLLVELEKRLLVQGIDEIILLTLKDPRTEGFYHKKGYVTSNDMIMMNKKIRGKKNGG
ncbi:MAG: GNAT family N-acetyltransferase [Beduini sp.]|uniref:GNAT family N-acetyltransferase n=1 Tax=Beduini sp. TaxID=1922300 RepID=UPI00399063BA